jgi:hypothetical protein
MVTYLDMCKYRFLDAVPQVVIGQHVTRKVPRWEVCPLHSVCARDIRHTAFYPTFWQDSTTGMETSNRFADDTTRKGQCQMNPATLLLIYCIRLHMIGVHHQGRDAPKPPLNATG